MYHFLLATNISN